MASYGEKKSRTVIRKYRFKVEPYNLPGMVPEERNVTLLASVF